MIKNFFKLPPPQADPRPTLNDWLSHDGNRQGLAAILADPVFRAAMAFVEEDFRVKLGDLCGPKALLAEEVVRKAAMHAAIPEARDALKKIVLRPMDSTTGDPEPWAHITPDNK
tara:strand:+ start:4482 stop:4823 length:342 start_codon:yes stop_codon:yes gene_type:complete